MAFRTRQASQVLPIWIYLGAIFFWPNSGLGNNGHCDAWYYWGMSHSAEIVQNTIAWNYYPASRVPLFIHGWIIPESLPPLIWAKLLMILGSIWPASFVLFGLEKSKWKLALNGYFLANLVPIIFSQSSANYSGITFNLLSVLGILLFFGSSKLSTNIIIGITIGFILFANLETLVLFPPLFYLYLNFLNDNKFKKITLTILGVFTSYLILVFLQILGGLGFQESISFPSIQINTLLKVIGDESFFGNLENPWYLATPLLMFHLVIICLLTIQHIKAWEIFPPLLLNTLILQVVSLIFGQITGFAVTFQSGFDAIIAYWPLATLYIFLLLRVSQVKKLPSYIGIVSFAFLVFSQLLVFAIRNLVPNWELIVLSTGIPLVALMLCLWLLLYKKLSIFVHTLALVLVIPLVGIHTLDYSYSFYVSENTPLNYKSNLASAEYEAASKTVEVFDETLVETSAIGAIEDPRNNFQTALLRASTRAFSSCGFPWSRFESYKQFKQTEIEKWPKQVILGSYRIISDKEFEDVFVSFKSIKRFEFEVQGQVIYWSLIQR